MIPTRQQFGGLGNRMFQMAYLYAKVKDGTIPDIYIQDEKWFENEKDEIKVIYGQGIGRIDMVSLHIRRGDYTGNSFYVDLCETDYYERAMAYFPDATFLIFCRDRQDEKKWHERSEWDNIKRRYSLYFWPELLLEEIIKNAHQREKERIKSVLERLEEKSELHKKIEKLLLESKSNAT